MEEMEDVLEEAMVLLDALNSFEQIPAQLGPESYGHTLKSTFTGSDREAIKARFMELMAISNGEIN